jgi:chemotaxis protein CheD
MAPMKFPVKSGLGSIPVREERFSTDPEGQRRYFHPGENKWLINVPAESFYVTSGDEVLCTTLGSCVSACVHDPSCGIGGLNHFLLPQEPVGMSPKQALRYGFHAMNQMLEELERMGGRRATMEAKIFGGGSSNLLGAGVGSSNVTFVLEYLRAEGMAVVAHDVGGGWARQVRFHPISGRARVRRLEMSRRPEIVEEERRLLEHWALPEKEGRE